MSLHCNRIPYRVRINGDVSVPTRTVILAMGAEYRRPALENLTRFTGAGVYFNATQMEAQVCGGEEVIVVGGGNSAGQAAVFLSATAKRVHIFRSRRESCLDDVAVSDPAHRGQRHD